MITINKLFFWLAHIIHPLECEMLIREILGFIFIQIEREG